MSIKTAFLLTQLAIFSICGSRCLAQDSIKPKTKIIKSTTAKPVYPLAAKPVAKVTQAVNQIPIQLPRTQVTPAPALSTDKSINGQYQFIMSKLYRYQQPMITDFYNGVQDTFKTLRTRVNALQSKLNAQSKTLTDLKTENDSKEESLNTVNTQASSINFLGTTLDKTTYNLIMWGLVILFGAVAVAVIFLSGSARREASYRTKLYNELEEDYKGYKTKANEKEKKLSRELQTVRNKLEEITGNPGY